jgi:hypothetical protein
MWEFILSWLVWLSADPVTLEAEYARAAAAVAAARASMATEPPTKAADCKAGNCPKR